MILGLLLYSNDTLVSLMVWTPINSHHQCSRRGGRGGGVSAGTSYLSESLHSEIVQ